MASKWVKLKGKYSTTVVSDLTSAASDKRFVERVDEKKADYQALTLPELMKWHQEFSTEWDDIEERKKELNVEFEAISQVIQAKFSQMGVSSVDSDEGQNFYLHIEPYISVADREAAENWVESDPQLEYLWSIQPKKLESLIKNHLEKGEDSQIPPCISVFLKTSVRCRKA